MDSWHYALVFLMIAIQVIGIVGYLRKKWNLKIYLYIFTIISVNGFWLGVMPIMLPNSSLIRHFFITSITTVGSIILAKILIMYAERKKKM
jgi:hypothetical protein